MFPEKTVVIGTGYVGLPLAIMLADAGCRVVGVDIDRNIAEAVNSGEMHIDEAELRDLLRHPEVRANLSGQTEACPADVFVIAVPTPLDRRKKVADLRHVVSAVESILPHLGKGNLLIVESTVPPLTCREIMCPLIERVGLRAGDDVLLAHCPERILPGDIFHEIVHNDRIIGGINPASAEAAKELYSHFVKGKLYLTDDVTAELCKLMENTYRDVNIALANELASVCDTLDVDVNKAIELANHHPRVNILRPGIGVGGHCIPIDPWFIKEVDPENCSLIFAARKINDAMPEKTAAKIRRAVRQTPEPKIVLLGATYKPDTYDLRESPALEVLRLLQQDGYQVEMFDPVTQEYGGNGLMDAVRGADCLAVLVEHRELKRELELHEAEIRRSMRRPVILRF